MPTLYPVGAHPVGSPVLGDGPFRQAWQVGGMVNYPITANLADADSYDVLDFYGNVIVDNAEITSSPIIIPNLDLGWYKLYVRSVTTRAAPWGNCGAEKTFSVVRTDATSPLLDRPESNVAPRVDPNEYSHDHPARGYCGVGPARFKITDLNSTSQLAGVLADIDYAATKRVNDSARPVINMLAFPNGFDNSPTQIANLTTIVQAAVSHGVVWFEGLNEPNVSMMNTAYAPQFIAFADTVHAAHASAKVMGPSMLSVAGNKSDGSGASLLWFNSFLQIAGVTSRMNGVSFHNYDSFGGEIAAQRRVMSEFLEVLQLRGISSLPIFNTEFGSTLSQSYGAFTPMWQARSTMLEFHIHEQSNIPKEQCYLFYDQSHGFWDFPSFWIMHEWDNGQMTPLGPLMRVWGEELFGKTFNTRYNFGSEEELWIGSKFVGSDGSSVGVFQSGGNVGTIDLTVTGTSSLVVSNCWGKLTTVPVVNGRITITVDSLPTYVRCPSGVSAVPVPIDWGVDVVTSGYNVHSATSNNVDAWVAFEGRSDAEWTTNNPGPVKPIEWAGASGLLPVTLQTTFVKRHRLNRIVLLGAAAHNNTCAITHANIKRLLGGVWTTIATINETTPFKMWTSDNSAGGGFVDDYYSRRNQWMFRFDTPIEADAIAVEITGTSYGGQGTNDSYQGAGAVLATGEIGQGGPRRGSLRELRIRLNEYDLGKTNKVPLLIRP